MFQLFIVIIMANFSRKKYFKLAKGFVGKAKNRLSVTIPRVQKSLQKAYIGRKVRPRTARRNWIIAINAGIRSIGLTRYSAFINQLNLSNVLLDRKILADLAKYQPFSFKAVHDQVMLQEISKIKADEAMGRVTTPNEEFPSYSRKRFSIEDMIRKNLLTATKLKESQYFKQPKTTVKVKYFDEDFDPDILQRLNKIKNENDKPINQ